VSCSFSEYFPGKEKLKGRKGDDYGTVVAYEVERPDKCKYSGSFHQVFTCSIYRTHALLWNITRSNSSITDAVISQWL
jgi:hypothetical protein